MLSLPWDDDDLEKINTNPNRPFKDKQGFLELSRKQMRALGGWQRPKQLFKNPKIVRGRLCPCDSGTFYYKLCSNEKLDDV